MTVSSFYLDETEVTNADYLEYLYWTKTNVDNNSYPEVYKKILPDTLVWRDKLGYNEPFVNACYLEILLIEIIQRGVSC